MTATQAEKLRAALSVPIDQPALALAIREAAPNIAGFLQTNACLPGYDGSALNRYAAPGVSYPRHNYIRGPVRMLARHPRSRCVDVHRVHDWSMPADNALRFEVVYLSEETGQSTKAQHELVRQPGGEWLFTR